MANSDVQRGEERSGAEVNRRDLVRGLGVLGLAGVRISRLAPERGQGRSTQLSSRSKDGADS